MIWELAGELRGAAWTWACEKQAGGPIISAIKSSVNSITVGLWLIGALPEPDSFHQENCNHQE